MDNVTIEQLKQQALEGFTKAQQDIQAARVALEDAGARLNYFKGASEALARLPMPVALPHEGGTEQ